MNSIRSIARGWTLTTLVFPLAAGGCIAESVDESAGEEVEVMESAVSPKAQNDMQTGGDAANLPSGAVVPPTFTGSGRLAKHDTKDCYAVPRLHGQEISFWILVDRTVASNTLTYIGEELYTSDGTLFRSGTKSCAPNIMTVLTETSFAEESLYFPEGDWVVCIDRGPGSGVGSYELQIDVQ